jgi:hypothetical protein
VEWASRRSLSVEGASQALRHMSRDRVVVEHGGV